MNIPFKVYLAGPIAGLNYAGATEWRNRATELIAEKSSGAILPYSPMRSKEYLAGETSIGGDYPQPMSTARAIVTRDFNDVKTADLILVNLLGAQKVSIGTVAEIAWCKVLFKPAILVMERSGNVHDHPFITEVVGFRVETLEDAATLACHILLP